MQRVNRSIIVVCLITLVAGLLLAQTCNAVCLLAGCGASSKKLITQQTRTKEQGHCHASPASPAPSPANDLQQCSHHEADAIQPASYLQADVVAQFNLQPVLVEPFLCGALFFPPSQKVSQWKPLRSPPRLSRHAILRI